MPVLGCEGLSDFMYVVLCHRLCHRVTHTHSTNGFRIITVAKEKRARGVFAAEDTFGP